MVQRTIGAWALVCVGVFSWGAVAAQEQSRSASQPAAAPAQQSASAVVAEPEVPRVVLQGESTASVLRLMKFSGLLRDRAGNPRTGAAGLTFALYKDQQGGSPLWLEVHNAQLDEQGRYTVLLGSTKSEGLPLELFSSGEARWLGVQLNLPGEEEQSRVLLVSVPYALKAADAETLGGKPPSAFLLADPVGADLRVRPEAGKEAVKEGPTRQAVQTLNFVQKQGASVLEDSSIFDNGNVGIGTTSPVNTLEVQSAGATAIAVVGPTNPQFRAQDTTNAAVGKFQALDSDVFVGAESNHKLSLIVNNTSKAVLDTAGRMGIGTASPANTLEVQSAGATAIAVLGPTNPQFRAQDTTNAAVGKFQALDSDVFVGAESNHNLSLIVNNTAKAVLDTAGNMGIGTNSPAQKLEVAGNVKITGGGNGIIFADSTTQTTAAVGTVTGVASGAGLTGGPITTTGTLSANFGGTGAAATVARSDHTHALAGFANTAVGAAALAANSGSSNTALGDAALNVNGAGLQNTAVGSGALGSNTSGSDNTALGSSALVANQTGGSNTAVGRLALNNNTASSNTAVGARALDANTSGTNNTAVGVDALGANQTGGGNTAVGRDALLVNTASGNTAVGAFALDANTSGDNNTAVGVDALGANETGTNNTALGRFALLLNTASHNTAVVGLRPGRQHHGQ